MGRRRGFSDREVDEEEKRSSSRGGGGEYGVGEGPPKVHVVWDGVRWNLPPSSDRLAAPLHKRAKSTAAKQHKNKHQAFGATYVKPPPPPPVPKRVAMPNPYPPPPPQPQAKQNNNSSSSSAASEQGSRPRPSRGTSPAGWRPAGHPSSAPQNNSQLSAKGMATPGSSLQPPPLQVPGSTPSYMSATKSAAVHLEQRREDLVARNLLPGPYDVKPGETPKEAAKRAAKEAAKKKVASLQAELKRLHDMHAKSLELVRRQQAQSVALATALQQQQAVTKKAAKEAALQAAHGTANVSSSSSSSAADVDAQRLHLPSSQVSDGDDSATEAEDLLRQLAAKQQRLEAKAIAAGGAASPPLSPLGGGKGSHGSSGRMVAAPVSARELVDLGDASALESRSVAAQLKLFQSSLGLKDSEDGSSAGGGGYRGGGGGGLDHDDNDSVAFSDIGGGEPPLSRTLAPKQQGYDGHGVPSDLGSLQSAVAHEGQLAASQRRRLERQQRHNSEYPSDTDYDSEYAQGRHQDGSSSSGGANAGVGESPAATKAAVAAHERKVKAWARRLDEERETCGVALGMLLEMHARGGSATGGSGAGGGGGARATPNAAALSGFEATLADLGLEREGPPSMLPSVRAALNALVEEAKKGASSASPNAAVAAAAMSSLRDAESAATATRQQLFALVDATAAVAASRVGSGLAAQAHAALYAEFETLAASGVAVPAELLQSNAVSNHQALSANRAAAAKDENTAATTTTSGAGGAKKDDKAARKKREAAAQQEAEEREEEARAAAAAQAAAAEAAEKEAAAIAADEKARKANTQRQEMESEKAAEKEQSRDVDRTTETKATSEVKASALAKASAAAAAEEAKRQALPPMQHEEEELPRANDVSDDESVTSSQDNYRRRRDEPLLSTEAADGHVSDDSQSTSSSMSRDRATSAPNKSDPSATAAAGTAAAAAAASTGPLTAIQRIRAAAEAANAAKAAIEKNASDSSGSDDSDGEESVPGTKKPTLKGGRGSLRSSEGSGDGSPSRSRSRSRNAKTTTAAATTNSTSPAADAQQQQQSGSFTSPVPADKAAAARAPGDLGVGLPPLDTNSKTTSGGEAASPMSPVSPHGVSVRSYDEDESMGSGTSSMTGASGVSADAFAGIDGFVEDPRRGADNVSPSNLSPLRSDTDLAAAAPSVKTSPNQPGNSSRDPAATAATTAGGAGAANANGASVARAVDEDNGSDPSEESSSSGESESEDEDEPDYEFVEGWDPNHELFYYFNVRTQASQWVKPPEGTFKPYNPEEFESTEDEGSGTEEEGEGDESGSVSGSEGSAEPR